MHQDTKWQDIRHRLLPRGGFCRLWFMLFFSLPLMLPLLSYGSETVGIDAVEYLLTDEANLPEADADWRPMTLPFRAHIDPFAVEPQSKASSWVWFRFKLAKPLDHSSQALLLWRLNLSAQIYFNGEYIAGSGERDGYTTVSWNRPLLAVIQSPAWQADENEVMIRLTRSRWGGNLAPVLFGPVSELEPLYKARLFRQVEVNKVLLVFGLFLALVTFVVWLRRRDEVVYLWFSVLALSWSVMTSHLVIYFNPIPYSVWLPLVHIAMDVCILSLYGFVGSMSGARIIQRERLFIVWTALAALVHFLVSPHWFFIIAYSIHIIGVTCVGFMMFRVVYRAIRMKDRTSMVISAVVFLQLVMFVYNAFLMFFDNAERWEKSMFFAHFGIPVLLLVFGAILLKRFVDALNEAEALNRELEQKVEASRLLIEQQYAERRKLELQQATELERAKIYRDLHDDVGSRLLTIIHTDQGSTLGDTARAALESLRQAVSRANTPDQHIEKFMDEVHEETELRLMGSGHEVIWNQPNTLPDIILPSHLAFNLNRILKELVSNIIRHANAAHVEVKIDFDSKQSVMYILLRDDGLGFADSARRGNGIGNIKSRVRELGGVVIWENSKPGTRVTITIPFQG